ncbi:recombination protein NinG [Flavobacterium sp.]|uniref:recombination protein NinG n=1 Tax=Flavobacterium sp. TaxID=239 RepID=UPI0038FC11D0
MAKKCEICLSNPIGKWFNAKTCDEVDCKVKHAIKIVEKQKIAKAKKVKQEWSKEKIDLKDKLKTITDWQNDLQKEINLIVRTLDKDHPCISSQRNLGKSYDAGHLFGRQSNPHIRYHLFNIYAQSVHDNQWKSGNQLEFVNGIELTFGSEIKEYCLSLKGLPTCKLSIDEIKEKIQISRGIVKWLKLQDKKFSIKERIYYRDKFNKEIGIYKI